MTGLLAVLPCWTHAEAFNPKALPNCGSHLPAISPVGFRPVPAR